MGSNPLVAISRFRFWRRIGPSLLLIGAFGLIRLSKGALFSEIYALLTRPFWPGTSQKEWIQSGAYFEYQTRISLLEKDNKRLREMLSLERSSNSFSISAAVISRQPKGWWQQLELGKGSLDGIDEGDAVLGPGGLLGTIYSVTPKTSRVRLLTSPGSRIGVWISRNKRHGILIGMGTNRPQLRFLDTDTKALPGDVVSTSPASTLMPPNLPVGVIQSVDNEALPAPNAFVQLTASPEAIDWVQVQEK